MAEMMPGKNGGALRRGGGNPGHALQHQVKTAIREGAMEVVPILMEKARNGDIRAIELVLAYGIGKPTERVEVSGPEGGPVSFVADLDDHEKRALRDAIRAHLATA